MDEPSDTPDKNRLYLFLSKSKILQPLSILNPSGEIMFDFLKINFNPYFYSQKNLLFSTVDTICNTLGLFVVVET